MCQLAHTSDGAALPNNGGWGNQDEAFLRNYILWLRGLNRKKWEKEHPDQAFAEDKDEELPDWRSAFGVVTNAE